MIHAALFSREIELVSGLTVISRMPHGTARAELVHDESRRRWVRKLEEHTTPSELLAEAMGFLLGRAIGARVANAAVCLDDGQRAWLSGYEEGLHWHPELADRIRNLDEVGAMLALDLILMNGDRHSQNMILVPSPDDARLRMFAIDAGNANVGWPTSYAVDAKEHRIPSLTNYERTLPFHALRSSAEDAANAAAKISEHQLRSYAREACAIAQDHDHEVLFEALRTRCSEATDLLPSMLAALELPR